MTDSKSQRILLVSDAKNEVDDQYAIVHALLTPRFQIVGMVASHFGTSESNRRSYDELIKIATLTDTLGDYPIKLGAAEQLDKERIRPTEGSSLIIEEALKAEESPLYVVCIGTLTDVATAIVTNPAIVDRFTLIWVGGGRYPAGSHEANLGHDILSANMIFSSEVDLWQIPSGAYKTMLVSVAELQLKISKANHLGAYLYEQLIEFAKKNIAKKSWINTECWVLGDSAAIGVLLDEQKGSYKLIPAPSFASDCSYINTRQTDRLIRVYDSLNVRLILEDFFAKISLFKVEVRDF